MLKEKFCEKKRFITAAIILLVTFVGVAFLVFGEVRQWKSDLLSMPDDIAVIDSRVELPGSLSGKNLNNLVADSQQFEVITLAGGCFWCSEAFLQETPGVLDVVSGYAGGEAGTATYTQVSKGKTNHREAVQVTYDPSLINTEGVLEVYWSHIDPTDQGGQFADRGFQYTTAIFYHNEEQKRVAEESKIALGTSGLFADKIATQIVPYTTFFPAEDYHQDYYKKASDHYERYKKASGRSGFIEDNWAREAALQFFADQEKQTATSVSETISIKEGAYVERAFSAAEIETGLKALSPNVYRIVAEEGTEPAFNNEYWDSHEAGIYVDVVTGRPLFSSTHKYDSKTGWPSFYQPINESSIILKTDTKLFTPRTEVRSESGHLGHVFNDGPTEYGGQRYCINSAALKFIPLENMEELGYGGYLYLFE